MAIPGVQGNIKDGGLGASAPLGIDTIVVVGPTTAGTLGTTLGTPTRHTTKSSVTTTYTSGPACDLACYLLDILPTPPTVLMWKTPGTTTAVLASIDITGVTGTAVSTSAGTPLDQAQLYFIVRAGGALGTAGMFVDTSWDNGRTFEPGPTPIGTSLTLPVINGVTITLGTSTATLVAGDIIRQQCTEAMPAAADVTAAITGLTAGGTRFRCLVVTGVIGTTEFATLDSNTSALGTGPDYAFLFANTIDRTGLSLGAPTQTDASYTTAMDTLWGASTNIYAANERISLWAGFGLLTANPGSPNANRILRRPAAWAVARRFMEQDSSVSLAQKSLGPLSSFTITDSNGNSVEHDERINGGIGGFTDPARLGTLRTFKGSSGTYVTLPWMKSAPGKDYIRVHYRAVMDLACQVATDTLTETLSAGELAAGNGTLNPKDANNIEEDILGALSANILQPTGTQQRPRASNAQVSVDTKTVLTIPGTPAQATIQIQPLIYLEDWNFTIGLVATITANGG